MGEAGVVGQGAAVPSGAHHSYGREQGSVAWQVEAQTVWGLEVMAVLQVGVLLRVDEQGLQGYLGLA